MEALHNNEKKMAEIGAIMSSINLDKLDEDQLATHETVLMNVVTIEGIGIKLRKTIGDSDALTPMQNFTLQDLEGLTEEIYSIVTDYAHEIS